MSALSQIQVGSTVYDIQAVEYIVGTQASATLNWTGVTESSSLEAGKVIAYKLPYAESNNLGRCTLNLTLSGGGTTGAKNVIDAYYAAEVPQRTSSPDQIVNNVYLLIYDGTAWQYLGGGAGGDSLPEYTVADKGKVLTLGETEGETIVVVPEQEVDGNDPLVGVTIEPTDIPLGTTGVFTAQEGNFEPKIAECVYQYDSDYGIYGFWTDEPSFESYVVVYDDNNWHQAIYDSLVTVSLTITNTSVEPKWEAVGGGEIVTTSENFVKTVTATTTTLSIAYVNGTELVISGGGTVVSGITTTTGSAVTAVDNDSNIANAYGEYF